MVYKSRSDVFFSSMVVKLGIADTVTKQRNLCHNLSRWNDAFVVAAIARKSHDGEIITCN